MSLIRVHGLHTWVTRVSEQGKCNRVVARAETRAIVTSPCSSSCLVLDTTSKTSVYNNVLDITR